MSKVSDEYEARWTRHESVTTSAMNRSRRLSSLRGVTFLGMVAALIAVDFLEGGAESLALGVLGALVVTFLGQVVVHRRVRREERWSALLAAIAREGVLRAGRRWSELEEALPSVERDVAPAPAGHPYAADLDMVGRASLFSLLGPVTSKRAQELVRDWLLTPGAVEPARARQDAIRELAPQADLRAEFTAYGRLEELDALPSLDRFLAWAEAEAVLPRRPWLIWGGRSLPLVLLLTVLADVVLAAGPWWLLPAAVQLWVVRKVGRATGASFAAVGGVGGVVRALVPQLLLLDGTTWKTALLSRIRDRLGHGPNAAHARLVGLLRLLDTVESRRNLVYATLAPVFLLDLHLGLALDRWRARHGSAVRDWLEASGEWEALSALSTLAHDHPDWCFPDLTQEGDPVVSAEGLGHPLLHPDRCVRNDVEVGPPGTFLLVTGSNMSGKSTLLRALGLNAVLAGAGAPVAADALRIPCMRVFTCMRVDDSLEEGVSLFMAELLRIRSVVEAARTPDPEEGRPVLYLLDEMLHGTNTAERRVAARGIVRHLVETGAIGAVSTHDLTLAETPELGAAAVPVHFREEVEGRGPDGRPRITFDYRLRPGIATTRNALKLLEAVGLRLPEDMSVSDLPTADVPGQEERP
ncbi:MAG: DNA mismatch repair protein MutS [Gemmatimonadota bacterium]